MAAGKSQNRAVDGRFSRLLSPDEELQRHLFQAFTLVGLTFLLVYGFLQAKAGLSLLAVLYIAVATIIAINSWAIRLHNKIAIAANVFASLGPTVLLPWQVTGGVANTGLMWFPVYVVFVMFFVPGKGGSLWVMFLYSASFFLLLLQLQGVVPLPFAQDVMFHFYFVGGVTYILSFYFLHAQRIMFDVLKMQLTSLRLGEATARLGTWTWDIPTDTMQWSEQLYDIFGLAVNKKVTPETYLKMMDSHDRHLAEETVREALADRQPYSLISRIRRSDKTTIWVHSLGEVECDASGRPTRLFGTVQDITERMAVDRKVER